MANKKYKLFNTYKVLAIAAVSILVLGFAFITWAGGKAVEFVKEKASNQTFLEGNLSIGDVGASLSGGVWINDIVWNGPKGELIAKIPRLDISVNFTDIFGDGLNASSINKIVLEKPELYLEYDEENGLNVINFIKVENKKDNQPKDGEKVKEFFGGTLEIDKGILQIVSGKNNLKFESFDCRIYYAENPKITGTLQAKQNKAQFIGKFEAENDKLLLNVEGASIAITDFFAMVPVQSNLTIEDGTILTLKTSFELVKKSPAKISVEGSFENIKAQTQGITFDTVKGNFNGDQDKVTLSGITGNFNNQAVKADGVFYIKKEPLELNLNISSEAFQISALSPGMGMNEAIAFQANITGTSDNPTASGNFSAPNLTTDQLALSNVKGNFSYNGGLLNIFDASANVYGGGVSAVGTVNIADKSFVFDINGSGINSTAMTETKIKGPLSFQAHATGVGDYEAVAANGSFVIGKGDFNGIPFNSLTGNFSKLGNNMRFSNVIVNTLAGTATTNATVNSNGKVRFDNIDVQRITKQDVKETVKDALKKEEEKAEEKVKDALKKLF